MAEADKKLLHSFGDEEILLGNYCLLLRDGLKHVNTRVKKNRIIRKDGKCNTTRVNISRRRELKARYLRDTYTTMLESSWSVTLLIFCMMFICTWLFYAIVYYTQSVVHGDMKAYIGNSTRKLCVANLQSFMAALLFSVETENNIGYGNRYVTTECPGAGITVCIQSLSGLILSSVATGLVFSKISRAKKRAETLIFSNKAVISLRDGSLSFQFRIGDMRTTSLCDAHIRLYLIQSKTTEEGQVENLYQHNMEVGFDDGSDRLFFAWPITISHVIDEDSPLYKISAQSLVTAQFEIIAILEGIVESTGMTTEATYSYLPSEIHWGFRFENIVTYQKSNGKYQVDYAPFHNIYPVSMTRSSAYHRSQFEEQQNQRSDKAETSNIQIKPNASEISLKGSQVSFDEMTVPTVSSPQIIIEETEEDSLADFNLQENAHLEFVTETTRDAAKLAIEVFGRAAGMTIERSTQSMGKKSKSFCN